MLLITTPGGAIQYANPRFCQVTGFSAERLAGTHLTWWMPAACPRSSLPTNGSRSRATAYGAASVNLPA
ncbi:MAG: PAS domain-containing protein [Zoogloea sp.]|nr:PAS domain-containing protein [Zoogloea sp.]